MKRYSFILLIVIFGCSNPQKVPVYNVYHVSINQDELNNTLSGYINTTKKDTIHSLNDSMAYGKALFMAGGTVKALRGFSNSKLGKAKVYYFAITDSLGISLGEKLGVLKIEEINERVSTIVDQETKDKFVY